MKKQYILLFAVIVIIFIGVGIFFTKNTASPAMDKAAIATSPNENDNPDNTLPIQGDLENEIPTLGDANAPVTIVEYGHFKCPACNRFFRETKPELAKKYIETGRVKFVWKDFPYEGGDAGRASEGAYCAKDQGKFWEFHDTLFTYIWETYYQKGINAEAVSVFTDDKLNEFSRQLGLDEAQFNSCLTSNKYAALVKSNFDEGVGKGAQATPTFFINGQKVVGAQPFSVFSQIIESKLK